MSFHDGNTIANILRGFLTICFVFLKNFVAKSFCNGVEGNCDVGGFLLLKHLQQCIGKTKRHRCIIPFGVYSGSFGKRKMRTIDQGVRIKEKEFFRGCAHSAKYRTIAKESNVLPLKPRLNFLFTEIIKESTIQSRTQFKKTGVTKCHAICMFPKLFL